MKSVTGYHSLNSLAIYKKASTNETLIIGLCMNYYLSTDNLLTTNQADPPNRNFRIVFICLHLWSNRTSCGGWFDKFSQ